MGMYNHVTVAPCFRLPPPCDRLWQTKSDFPVGDLSLALVTVGDFGLVSYSQYYTPRKEGRVTGSGILGIHDFENPHTMEGWLEYDLHIVAGHLARIVDVATNETFWERKTL